MTVCKYKVGDRVRVVKPKQISNTSHNGSKNGWTSQMDKAVGKEFLISILDKGGGYRLGDTSFSYLEEWLEPVAELSQDILPLNKVLVEVEFETLAALAKISGGRYTSETIHLLEKESGMVYDHLIQEFNEGIGNYYEKAFEALKTAKAEYEKQFITVEGKKYKKDEYEALMEKHKKELENLSTY